MYLIWNCAWSLFESYPLGGNDKIKGSLKLLSAVSLAAWDLCNSFSFFCLYKAVVNCSSVFEFWWGFLDGFFLVGWFEVVFLFSFLFLFVLCVCVCACLFEG